MSEHTVQWNAAKEEWLCLKCLRSSDHLTMEDAERELSKFGCLSTFPETNVVLNERRQSDRKRTPVQVEILLRDRTAPLRVSTSDLSLGGCYVENMFTLPLGAFLTISLWIEGEKLKIDGIVKTCDPVFGNGIEFIELPPLERFKLRAYLDSVRQD